MSDLNKAPILVRQATQGDVNFIFNSWLKSAHGNLPKLTEIPHNIFYSEHHKLLEKILRRCTVLIACDKNDQTVIYGYIVAEIIYGFPVIHYVYVKQPFRRLGIAKMLLNCLETNNDSVIFTSHISKSFNAHLSNKRHFIYNPYLLHEYSNTTASIGFRLVEELGNKDEIKN